MSFEKVQHYLEQFGLADRAMNLSDCSGTVAQAAADLGCDLFIRRDTNTVVCN